MAHVAAWKKKRVSDLTEAMAANPVVAIVDVHGIPAPQMQAMRKSLRSRVSMIMTRNKLMRIAIDEVATERPGLEGLKEAVDGQCAVVSTNMNPFMLFREMENTKTAAAAKPGEIAPDNIMVKKGDTPFKPGPIVGDLQKIGLPAAIERGKIIIKKDKILVKAGDPIPEDVAKMLPKLEILPMTVGLDLIAVFEDGVIYGRDVLNIPEDYYPTMFATAARNAISLGVSVAYPTNATMQPILGRAFREALGLSIAAAIPTSESIKFLLAKADSHMIALASQAPDLVDERVQARLSAQSMAAAPVATVEKEEQEEEENEEEVSEEEAAAGLSALFG